MVKLYIKKSNGRYYPAPIETICESYANYLSEKLSGKAFHTAEAVKEFIQAKMAHLEREYFNCMFLDNKHKLITFETLFQGTIDASAVYPREIVKRALEVNAAAVILAHNHPSGDPQPSVADTRITKRLTDALALIDVRVLDHIITGTQGNVSMAEHGLI